MLTCNQKLTASTTILLITRWRHHTQKTRKILRIRHRRLRDKEIGQKRAGSEHPVSNDGQHCVNVVCLSQSSTTSYVIYTDCTGCGWKNTLRQKLQFLTNDLIFHYAVFHGYSLGMSAFNLTNVMQPVNPHGAPKSSLLNNYADF